MALVSVTRLHLRSWWYLLPFMGYAVRATQQAKIAPGILDVQTRKTEGLAFWTLTTWMDEAAMRAYMGSGAHRQAMPKLIHWCDEAASVHWQQPDPQPPSWEEAAAQLQAQGRLFNVAHPSPAYATGTINIQ